MNIGVAIVSIRKWKHASLSRSVLLFGASPARFVALMNIENPCYSRPSSKTKGGGLSPPPPTKRPIDFRPLQLRRSCGRWNWQPHRSLPEEFRQSPSPGPSRSEEHTSELQSHLNLVCRLLLEKKKDK